MGHIMGLEFERIYFYKPGYSMRSIEKKLPGMLQAVVKFIS